MSLERLKAEIVNDPLGRNYAGMTNSQILASLATPNISRDRDIIQSHEIVAAIVPSEWDAITAAQRERINFIVGAGSVNVRATNVRSAFTTAFGAGTQTRTNLVALLSESISRSQQLGLPAFLEGDVQWARTN